MEAYPITVLCRVLEVSRSGYNLFLKRPHSNAVDKDFELLSQIHHIHKNPEGLKNQSTPKAIQTITRNPFYYSGSPLRNGVLGTG